MHTSHFAHSHFGYQLHQLQCACITTTLPQKHPAWLHEAIGAFMPMFLICFVASRFRPCKQVPKAFSALEAVS
jgi:hypothetical protein